MKEDPDLLGDILHEALDGYTRQPERLNRVVQMGVFAADSTIYGEIVATATGVNFILRDVPARVALQMCEPLKDYLAEAHARMKREK